MVHVGKFVRSAGAGLALAWVACVSLPGIDPPGSEKVSIPSDNVTPTPSPSDGMGGGTPTPTPTPTAPPVFTSWLHQSGGVIKDATNANVLLHGIGWYGFDGSAMLDVASAPYANRLGTDVVTIMQRLHLMGFNTVEFEISFTQLYNADGSAIIASTGTGVACSGTSTSTDIVNSVTIPGFAPHPNAPLLTYVPTLTPGMCNDYLPGANAAVVQRLAAIVDIFTRNGFYVILQESLKHDIALVNDPTTFSQRWQQLASDLVKYGAQYENMSQAQASCTVNPNQAPLAICRNLLIGIMNDTEGLTPIMSWEASGSRPLGAHTFYIAALTAIRNVLPRAMFLVAGAQQNGYTTTFNTGVDIRTGTDFPGAAGDPNVYSAHNFFQDVLNTVYESQVMFTFNAFGPDSGNGDLVQYESSIASKVAGDMTASYAFLATQGVPDYASTLHPFPLVPVALGGNPGDTNDSAFLAALRTFMQSNGLQSHFVWWCWSGDTSTHSSIVDATQYDTLTPSVVNFLKTLGLTPL